MTELRAQVVATLCCTVRAVGGIGGAVGTGMVDSSYIGGELLSITVYFYHSCALMASCHS